MITSVYQKHELVIGRLASAGALAGLVYLSGLLVLYPAEWQLVVPLAVFVAGTLATPWGYAFAVASLAYPLLMVSPYLCALFLAVTVIPLGWVVRHIWVAILVAASPLLIGYGLGFLAPLLCGLIISKRAGLVAGLGARVWLTLLASFSYGPGANTPQGVDALRTRFANAGSFGTVANIIAPFFPGSVGLLANILQLVAWAAAGYLVGLLADWGAQRAEARAQFSFSQPQKGDTLFAVEQIGWRAILPLLVGVAILVLGLSYLPALLNQPLTGVQTDLAAYGLAAASSALVALGCWLLLWYLRQPVAVLGLRGADFGISRTGSIAKPKQPATAAPPPVRVAPPTTQLDRPASQPQKQALKAQSSDERVIMIEID